MGKTIKSIAQLEGIKNEFLKNQEKYKYQILVCGGTGCVSSNCADVENAINEALEEQGIAKDVRVFQTGCMGICALGPVMMVLPDRTFYTQLDPEKAKEIVKSHLVDHKIIEEYTFYDKTLLRYIPKMD